MSEDEYLQGEPDDDFENEDDEIIGDYLIDEPDDDLTLIMMPKIQFDFEVEFDTYYKMLRKCKSKEQMKYVLSEIIQHSSNIILIEHEIKYLQDRAKDFEFNIALMQAERNT
jgi:hypothetical protein